MGKNIENSAKFLCLKLRSMIIRNVHHTAWVTGSFSAQLRITPLPLPLSNTNCSMHGLVPLNYYNFLKQSFNVREFSTARLKNN